MRCRFCESDVPESGDRCVCGECGAMFEMAVTGGGKVRYKAVSEPTPEASNLLDSRKRKTSTISPRQGVFIPRAMIINQSGEILSKNLLPLNLRRLSEFFKSFHSN